MLAVVIFCIAIGFWIGCRVQARDDRKNLVENLLKHKGKK